MQTPNRPQWMSAFRPSRSFAGGWSMSAVSQPTGVEIRLHQVFGASPTAGSIQFDSPVFSRGYLWPASPEALHAWPKAVTTDPQGRFVFAGVGRGLFVSLSVRDPRFAEQRFDLEPGGRDDKKEISLALHPARIIEGRVLTADSRQPVPSAVISVRASFGRFGSMVTTRFRADDKGRFKITPYAGDYFRMHFFSPQGQPYLPREAEFEWTKGAVKKEMDASLLRGVLIRGKVVEEGSGCAGCRSDRTVLPEVSIW